jgi:hypothetical protein
MQRVFDNTLLVIQAVLPDIKETRWSNKTDFYTLFVATASILRSLGGSVAAKLSFKKTTIRKTLDSFAAEVDARLGDEDAQVRQDAIDYVRAVEKGANDKARRAERHRIMTQLIERYFSVKNN